MTQSARPRILILRSCRMAQLLAAIVWARTRNRTAEIVALSHHGHRYLLYAAGADRVIEVPGRRFGLVRMAPWLWRLRSEGFSEVVIPQMTADPDQHVNLYQMVAAIQPPRVTIVPGEERPQTFDGARFLQFAMQHSYLGPFENLNAPAVTRMFLASCLGYRHAA
jgi:hypothetical protein